MSTFLNHLSFKNISQSNIIFGIRHFLRTTNILCDQSALDQASLAN